MSVFVLDCSVTMSWAFKEEFTPFMARSARGAAPTARPSCRHLAGRGRQRARGGRAGRAADSRPMCALRRPLACAAYHGAMPSRASTPSMRCCLWRATPVSRPTMPCYLELAMRLGLVAGHSGRQAERAAARVGVPLLSMSGGLHRGDGRGATGDRGRRCNRRPSASGRSAREPPSRRGAAAAPRRGADREELYREPERG